MDCLGYRMKIGAPGPSTNTIVPPDFDHLRLVGVTNYYSHIISRNGLVNTAEEFLQLVQNIQENALQAQDALNSSGMRQRHLMMGMSAAVFWDGRKGAEKCLDMTRNCAGVSLFCSSFATEAAFNTYKAKRIAYLTPYFPIASDQVRRFYQDGSFAVVRGIHQRRPSPVQIAHTTDEMYCDEREKLDGPDADTILQGWHQPLDDPLRGVCRVRFWQGRNRHQHGNVLACAARLRHQRQAAGLRQAAVARLKQKGAAR